MSDKLDGGSIANSSITETQIATAFANKVTNAYNTANAAYNYANTIIISASANTSITGNLSIESGSKLIVNGTTTLSGTVENINVSSSALTANINFDVLSQSVLYLTTNASANGTINFRGSSTISLNNFLTANQVMTVSLLVTNGAAAYVANNVQIDSVLQTVKWAGGTAPTTGNPSSVDLYSFTIIKTAALTYTVLASQQKYT